MEGSSLTVLPNPYGAKIYNVSVGKSLPQWISDKKKKSLRRDADYRRRIELLQDFEYPTASQRIKVSPNGEYILSAGTYPPQLKVHEVNQLTLKFERHLENEIVNFHVLSDDYSKLVFLRADRTVEIHAQFGKYYTLRIPKFGRDLIYDDYSCDMYFCGAGNEVYRLNLEQGQFMNSLETNLPGMTTCDRNKNHNLLCFGGENGVIECWDPRARRKVAEKDIALDLQRELEGQNIEISSIKFDTDGLTLGVGTSSGHCLLYDLRSSKPYIVKDHQYGFPIKNISFQKDKKVITTDTKIIKVWDRENGGKIHASIEPPCDINDTCVVPDSGLLLLAVEQTKMLAYFAPFLGPAPRWCSFLDNLTEELEEDKQVLYDDYKFVTKEELNKLGLNKLIGSEYLKAYMHGFFMDMRMYKKFKAIADPFEYDNYKQDKIKEKIEKERETRIAVKKKLPKVNAKTATRILQESENQSSKKKKQNTSAEILSDPRFAKMFEDPDFQVDEEDEKFKHYHPNEKQVTQEDIDEHFEQVDSDSEEDLIQNLSGDEEDEDEEIVEKEKKPLPKTTTTKEKKRKLGFYELKSGHEHALNSAKVTQKEKSLPFSQRVKKVQQQQKSLSGGEKVTREGLGTMQLTFVPAADKAKRNSSDEKRKEWLQRTQNRRGVKDLNLPKMKSGKKH